LTDHQTLNSQDAVNVTYTKEHTKLNGKSSIRTAAVISLFSKNNVRGRK